MSYPCGAADFVDNLSSKLSQFEQVSVITSNPNSIQSGEAEVKIFQGPWSLLKVMKIAKWIKENNFDIVDVQYEAYMYANKGAVLLLPLFLPKRTKKILTLHSEGLPKIGKKFWRLIQYSLFQEVIFYSEHFLKNALSRFGSLKEKFHLIPFPSNITRIEQTPLKKIFKQSFKGLDPASLYVSYFGHLSPGRGIEEMIYALKNISSNRLNLILIGQFIPETNAYHRDLSLLIRKFGVENQITFTERLDEKEVSSILQISDVGLLPFTEGASFKNGSLAAYVAHQVPVVTSKSQLTEDILLKNKGIHFFDYKNPGEMTGILENILHNSAVLEDMKQEIGKLADYYSWDNYIKNRLTYYQK
jgi:glycosyltransferase involved in cell wall biosynthesis